MRSTRSSALRCPSWRMNTLTICSRLLERLPPAGLRRLMSGKLVITDRVSFRMARSTPAADAARRLTCVPVEPARRRLDAERRTAPARRRGVRVLDGEAAAGDGVDEIDLGALEVADADRVDEQLDAVRLVYLI